jgi:hypothetical protein
MTARGPIAHGGPQRFPTRVASSLVRHSAAHVGPLRGLHGRSAADLTSPTIAMQPTLMSAAWSSRDHHAGLLPPVISVITITGIGNHLQPEWLIIFTGMRRYVFTLADRSP